MLLAEEGASLIGHLLEDQAKTVQRCLKNGVDSMTCRKASLLGSCMRLLALILLSDENQDDVGTLPSIVLHRS